MGYLMDCLNTTKSLKINLKRNIGTVVLIVEGASDEFKIFKQIFRNILHYNYIEKSRNNEKYREFIMKNNENSRVIVINSNNSNLSTIKKDNDYLNEVYKSLYVNYGIDIKNVRVYFVWDRDNDSNPKEVVQDLIKKLGNSLDNGYDEMNGLLLLSYPNVEGYIISNFEKNTLLLKENNLKKYVKDKMYRISDIDKHTLLNATVIMNKALLELDVRNYDLDNFSKTSLKVYTKEEELMGKNKYYNLLSLISIILLDLNIITEREY